MSGPVKVVVALGGNALEDKALPPTAESQLQVARRTAEYLAQLSCAGYELAVVHGNGPQVGRILLASETAADVTPPMPFDACGAMSQGYIGYHLQQALTDALHKRDRRIPVVTVVTQMVVDCNDPAFQNPTKPIGPFYSKEQADTLAEEKGYHERRFRPRLAANRSLTQATSHCGDRHHQNSVGYHHYHRLRRRRYSCRRNRERRSRGRGSRH